MWISWWPGPSVVQSAVPAALHQLPYCPRQLPLAVEKTQLKLWKKPSSPAPNTGLSLFVTECVTKCLVDQTRISSWGPRLSAGPDQHLTQITPALAGGASAGETCCWHGTWALTGLYFNPLLKYLHRHYRPDICTDQFMSVSLKLITYKTTYAENMSITIIDTGGFFLAAAQPKLSLEIFFGGIFFSFISGICFF